MKDGEERGLTAAEFRDAQLEGWEKQYLYRVGRKKVYMTPTAAAEHGYARADKHPKRSRSDMADKTRLLRSGIARINLSHGEKRGQTWQTVRLNKPGLKNASTTEVMQCAVSTNSQQFTRAWKPCTSKKRALSPSVVR